MSALSVFPEGTDAGAILFELLRLLPQDITEEDWGKVDWKKGGF
jgi:hypothetical protein